MDHLLTRIRIRRAARGGRGFTIIEAMISMFFITFIVSEMAMVSGYAGRSSNLARRLTQANLLAEQAQEFCRNAPYLNLQSAMQFKATDQLTGLLVTSALETVVACTDPPAATNRVCLQTTLLGYTLLRAVTPVPVPPSTTVPAFAVSEIADIDLVVSWIDAQGSTQQVIVSTMRAKY